MPCGPRLTPTIMKRFLHTTGQPTGGVRSLAVLVVVSALILALIVQHQRASAQIRTLRRELANAQELQASHERMHRLLGYRGLSLLKTATRVEKLKVGRVVGANDSRTPTGIDLDRNTANQLRRALLDVHHYLYLNADDFPEPQAGFRFQDGPASLDILVSLEGPNTSSPHADLFFIINTETGSSEHRGQVCMYSQTLSDLLAVVLRQNGPDSRRGAFVDR